jgi:transcriptional regulator with XRE-family HTH domain
MPKNSYLLTEEGLKKVNAAFVTFCQKPFPSREEMGRCVGLDRDTIGKLQKGTGGVNRDTLERLCNGLGWDLEIDLKENLDYVVQEPGVLPIPDPAPEQWEPSSFYVERVPYEAQCYEAILQPGALIRIKASQQMGKTLLLDRILTQARKENYQTVTVSFELPDSTVFNDMHIFSRRFCAFVSKQLGLPSKLADYWSNDSFCYNDNTTDYFEDYLLAQLTNPMILALDKVDRVFEHPAIANDFCSLLRGWYDMARRSDHRGAIWKKIRLVVVHSTDIYGRLDINRSPLAGVGLTIRLLDFNLEQMQDLARRHGLDWVSNQEVEQLMAMVGGHPYLVQLAFEYLKSQKVTLEKLLPIASTEASPFSDHLREHLRNLKRYPEIEAAFREVVMTNKPVKLESGSTFKLDSMGLIQIQNDDCTVRCNLYRQYFSTRLTAT